MGFSYNFYNHFIPSGLLEFFKKLKCYEISVLTQADLKKVTKKDGWLFDWKFEFKQPERDLYKLTIIGNPTIIQGLVSLEVKAGYVFMHLVESAPFNKGKTKLIDISQINEYENKENRIRR